MTSYFASILAAKSAFHSYPQIILFLNILLIQCIDRMGACCDQQSPAKRHRNYQPPRLQQHNSEDDEPAPPTQRNTLTPVNTQRLRSKFLQMEGEKRGLIACLENDISRRQKKLQEMVGEENSGEKEKLRRQVEFNQRLVQQSQEELNKIRARIANL